MHLGPLCGDADNIPGAITHLWHDTTLLSPDLRVYFGTTAAGEFLKEFAFFRREVHREYYFDACNEIAAAFAAQVWHTFAREPEGSIILSFRWNGQHQLAPIG